MKRYRNCVIKKIQYQDTYCYKIIIGGKEYEDIAPCLRIAKKWIDAEIAARQSVQ